MPIVEMEIREDATMKTHYHEFKHPNLITEEDIEDVKGAKTGCMAKFGYWDSKFMRPFFIYKYDKLKKRPQFELEDVLAEY